MCCHISINIINKKRDQEFERKEGQHGMIYKNAMEVGNDVIIL